MMVSVGAAKGLCVLPIVLDSGLGMPMIARKFLERTHETRPDVQALFQHKSKLTVTMAYRRSTLLTQQTYLLKASVLLPLAPVGIKLAVAFLLSGDFVAIVGSRMLHQQGLQPRRKGQAS